CELTAMGRRLLPERYRNQSRGGVKVGINRDRCSADRQLLRVLRRPLFRSSRDARGRADRRPHRRVPGRADDADPLEVAAQGSRGGLRDDFPQADGGGRRPGDRPRSEDRRQRRRPQPGRSRNQAARAADAVGPGGVSRSHRGRRPAPAPWRAPGRRQRASPSRHWPLAAEAGVEPVSANVYLGAWGIVEALNAGADIVVCPRVTDASLVVGPAAWRFGWARDDWDRLAGAVVAGHVIECGAQATGGNYSFFSEVPGITHL